MNENELTLNEIKESRKHKLKVWLATLGVALFSGLVAVGVFATQSYKKSNAISYDDSSYTVTFSADDLNTVTFNNFSAELSTLVEDDSIHTLNNIIQSLTYDSNTSSLDTESPKDNGYSFLYVLDSFNSDIVQFNYGSNGNNTFLFLQDGETATPFDNSLVLVFTSTTYNSIKSAIELDISSVEDEPSLVLSAYDLNNKTYGYLANQLNSATQSDLQDSYVIYDGIRFDFEHFGVNDNLTYLGSNSSYLYFYLNTLDGSYSRFNLEDGDSGNIIPFTHDLYIYSNFIEENIYAPMDTNGFVSILNTIVSILTGGIVGVSTGVGAGVSTLVSDIFVSNNALSVMGAMIVIFAGISLAIGLSRWIMNFLTSLGAKK